MPDELPAQPDSTPDHTGLIRRVVGSLVVVALLVGGLYVLGATHPAKRSAVTSDRLGPDSGEAVQTYLDESAAGLARVGSGVRWALISLRAPVDDDTAWSLMAGTFASQVAFHVPIARVATPATFAVVTGDRRSLTTARERAIVAVETDQGAPDPSADRDGQVSSVTTGRLRAGCACVVAMVVRADGPRLRAVAAAPQVRGVEVLPADAPGGRFAVVALLPEQTDRVTPLDDTGAVPSR